MWTISGSKRRALLGGENLGHGVRIEGIGREAVNGLGGQGDDFAGTQQRAGLAHGVLHVVIVGWRIRVSGTGRAWRPAAGRASAYLQLLT